ncbi:MAG: glycosyl transferase family 2 [Phycisphaeraceae bacterium]|nr:glycosyl transferase family 2 [Phycisphaeraceae bacterium]
MLNILMPMAGRGKRFAEAGYTTPKPLIKVHGIPLTELVIRNITPSCKHRFIFACLQEHINEFGFDEHLRRWAPGCVIIPISQVTAGAACTALLARQWIENDDQLMIANCDQWVDINIDDYLKHMTDLSADGLIMTMNADDPKWSYAGLNEDGMVTNVVEKEVISDQATVGIYNYAKGRYFCKAADTMIERKFQVNGEYYIAPAYNVLIEQSQKIVTYSVGSEFDGMYGLGTPYDLERFLKNPISTKAARR